MGLKGCCHLGRLELVEMEVRQTQRNIDKKLSRFHDVRKTNNFARVYRTHDNAM